MYQANKATQQKLTTMKNAALNNVIEAFTTQSIFNAYQQKDYQLMDSLQEDIQSAWNSWSDDVTREHWGGNEKPEDFTPGFAAEYLENEDFDAAGYDVDFLNSFFS